MRDIESGQGLIKALLRHYSIITERQRCSVLCAIISHQFGAS